MKLSLSRLLLPLTVTPFLAFGTPAIMATGAHADTEITTEETSDGSWFGDDGGSSDTGDTGDSGWAEGDGWGEETLPADSGETDCGDARSRC